MVSLSLLRHFPTIRTRANTPDPMARGTVTLDKANTRRSTTLDRAPGAQPRRKADVGPDSPARFLQVLVESISGLGLASFFPVAQGLPRIIGVDGLTNPDGFQSFLEGFFRQRLKAIIGYRKYVFPLIAVSHCPKEKSLPPVGRVNKSLGNFFVGNGPGFDFAN